MVPSSHAPGKCIKLKVTSRADSDETKLNSIALAIAVAAKNA